MTKLWGGRFDADPADALLTFTSSVGFDVALVQDDCAVLAAHAARLAQISVLQEHEAEEVARALEAIAADITGGVLEPRVADEDIHTTVERALLDRLPEIGPKVRAGLSRNDRVATAVRRWLLRSGADVVSDVLALIDVLIDRAEEQRATVMPGYTHLQRAQPVTLAHHLLAHAFALTRDAERLRAALDRTDASPLGAGALAGGTLGLDHAASAADLGFTRAMHNSLDAVAARDFIAEFLAAAALLGVSISRIAEEIVLWSTAEFGFVHLDDAYATGSSLMPQKKNPDIAELARGKAGRLIGHLTGILAMLKGMPLAYNRDLQEDKEPLFDAVATLRRMLPAFTGMVATMTFDADAMRDAVSDDVLATDLADALVRAGMPFREAHDTVGRWVASGDILAAAGEHAAGLSIDTSISARTAPGPASVDRQLEALRETLAALRR